MKRGLCRLSNFENRTTTGRAIAILMTEIKIEKRLCLHEGGRCVNAGQHSRIVAGKSGGGVGAAIEIII